MSGLLGYLLAGAVLVGIASIAVSLVRVVVSATEIVVAGVVALARLGERLRQDERAPVPSRH